MTFQSCISNHQTMTELHFKPSANESAAYARVTSHRNARRNTGLLTNRRPLLILWHPTVFTTGVEPAERFTPLHIMGTQLTAPLKPFIYRGMYSTRGLERGPELGPHYSERRKPLTRPMAKFPAWLWHQCQKSTGSASGFVCVVVFFCFFIIQSFWLHLFFYSQYFHFLFCFISCNFFFSFKCSKCSCFIDLYHFFFI